MQKIHAGHLEGSVILDGSVGSSARVSSLPASLPDASPDEESALLLALPLDLLLLLSSADGSDLMLTVAAGADPAVAGAGAEVAEVDF